jgi:hypothetical protein
MLVLEFTLFYAHNSYVVLRISLPNATYGMIEFQAVHFSSGQEI